MRDLTLSVNLTCTIYSGCTPVGTGTLAQAQASVGDGGVIYVGGGGVLEGADASLGSQGNGASSGGSSGDTAGGSGGHSGCSAAPGSRGSGVGLGAFAGLLGLVVGRVLRARRRARSRG